MSEDQVLDEILKNSAEAIKSMVMGFLDAKDAEQAAKFCQMGMSAGISMVAESATIMDKLFHPELADETTEQTRTRRDELVTYLQIIIASMTKIPLKPDSGVPYEAAIAFATANVQRWAANASIYPEAAVETAESLTKGMISGLVMSILGPAGVVADRAGANVTDEEIIDSATNDSVDVICEAAQRVSDKWVAFFDAMIQATPGSKTKRAKRGV